MNKETELNSFPFVTFVCVFNINYFNFSHRFYSPFKLVKWWRRKIGRKDLLIALCAIDQYSSQLIASTFDQKIEEFFKIVFSSLFRHLKGRSCVKIWCQLQSIYNNERKRNKIDSIKDKSQLTNNNELLRTFSRFLKRIPFWTSSIVTEIVKTLISMA